MELRIAVESIADQDFLISYSEIRLKAETCVGQVSALERFA